MEKDKDILAYIGILRARTWYFIGPTAVVLVVAAMVALLLPSIYESSSTILIEEQQIPPDFVKTTVTGFAEQRIQSLTQQILSSTRLLEIVRQFNLYPEMRGKYTQEEIIEKMRHDIKLDTISAELSSSGKKRKGSQDNVTIAFSVSYRGKNPDTVQQVSGTLASLYLQENLKIREEQAKSTTRFLETELKEIQERIRTIGQKITAFKSQHEGILPELQQFNLGQAERLDNEIKQLDAQIRAAEDRRIYLQGQLATVKPDTPIIGAAGERVLDPASRLHYLQVVLADLQAKFSPDHPDIRKIRRELAELKKLTGHTGGSPSLRRQKIEQLRAELAQMQGRYSEQHPEVVKLKKEMEQLEREPEKGSAPAPVAQPENPAYINLLTNLNAAENDLGMLRRQRVDLQEKLKMYRQRLEEAPQVEQEYLALTRDYQNAHAKHQEVMNKILEARIAEGMEESQKAEKFTLIDPASFPERPVSPKRGLIFLAGLILSLGSGLAAVALIEHLDHSVKNADELAWLTGLPVLGRIAFIETAEDLARKIQKKKLAWSLAGLSLIAALLVFHFFLMDLWILAAKLRRLADKYT